MRNRLLLAVVVLGAVVAWARCSFNPSSGTLDFNGFFAGCFEGPVTDPAGSGTLTIVLEEVDPNDQLTLAGCFEAALMLGKVQASLAGSVQDNRLQAKLTAMPVGGAPPFSLLAVRQPADNTAATSLDLSNDGGAPFNMAAGLVRCTKTCADLGIAVPFTGGGQP